MPTTEPINPGPVAVIRVPNKFYDDRAGRELACGRIEKRTAMGTTVVIRRDELIDLLDDATYYYEMKGSLDAADNDETIKDAVRVLESIAIQIGESDDPAIERYLTKPRISGERKRAKRAERRAARRRKA